MTALLGTMRFGRYLGCYRGGSRSAGRVQQTAPLDTSMLSLLLTPSQPEFSSHNYGLGTNHDAARSVVRDSATALIRHRARLLSQPSTSSMGERFGGTRG
jgi:hypothetical protein